MFSMKRIGGMYEKITLELYVYLTCLCDSICSCKFYASNKHAFCKGDLSFPIVFKMIPCDEKH